MISDLYDRMPFLNGRRRRRCAGARRHAGRARSLRFEGLEPRDYLAADLSITEFMASNEATLVDTDGNASDWIELHNSGDEPVRLLGWSLTDDTRDPDKWSLPNVGIDPGGYLVVFASAKDRTFDSFRLTTDFNATPDGTFLVDLPDGMYDIRVTLGDATRVRDDIQIHLQGSPVGMVTTDAGEFVSRQFTAEVNTDTGGQLAVRFEDTGGETGRAAVNALVITPVAGGEARQFDFGTSASPIERGFTPVRPENNYTRGIGFGWQAATTLAGGDRGVVEDNLHTNFKLKKSGEYLALVSPEGVVASEYGRDGSDFPEQRTDVSYGIYGEDHLPAPDDANIGPLARPTPGAANAGPRGAVVEFSRPSGRFVDPFTITLQVETPDTRIHFTIDGSEPTLQSPIYNDNEPITIASTTFVQAFAALPGPRTGPLTSVWYATVDSDVGDFTSNLPIVTLDTFGGGTVVPGTFKLSALAIYEPDEVTGRSSLVGRPDIETRAGLKVRGATSTSRAKKQFALETWDSSQRDRDISPLGMPAESDWVLFAPYNTDVAMLRNSFIFEISNQMGRYAVRTRFVELFLNTQGDDLAAGDYRGVYVLMEKPKRGPDRVDIERLEPQHNSEPEISGGWLLKIDESGPGDSGFLAGGQGVSGGNRLQYVDPKEDEVSVAQTAWIKDYIDVMAASLTNPDPQTGYAQYIDVDSWIDHHILNEFVSNGDGLRRSTFLFKDRGGKLEFGPLWDFDVSIDSPDGRDNRPDTFRLMAPNADYPWWGTLFQDPGFAGRWWDRWFELRQGVLSETNVVSVIDSMAAEIEEAQERNFARWPDIGPRISERNFVARLTNPAAYGAADGAAPMFGGDMDGDADVDFDDISQFVARAGGTYDTGVLDGTWRGEVEHMKAWLMERLAWIDSQFPG